MVGNARGGRVSVWPRVALLSGSRRAAATGMTTTAMGSLIVLTLTVRPRVRWQMAEGQMLVRQTLGRQTLGCQMLGCQMLDRRMPALMAVRQRRAVLTGLTTMATVSPIAPTQTARAARA